MYLFIRITYHIRSYAVLMMFVIDHSNLHTAVLLTTVWLRVVLKIDMKRYRQAWDFFGPPEACRGLLDLHCSH